MNVLKNIKSVRRQKGISQHQMADKLNITASTYQKIEQGLISLSVERFIEICRILDIKTYNDLLPAVNADSVNEIEKVIMSGYLAFDIIRNNANYVRKLLSDILDKIESDSIDKKTLSEELRFLDNYLEIIGKESYTNTFKFTSIQNIIEKID